MGWVILSALCFGIMPVLAHVAYAAGMDPVTLLASRFLIASACMAPILWRHRSGIPQGRQLGILILMGGVGFVGEALAFFHALEYASAGIVSLLLYLYPAIVALSSFLLFREPLTLIKRVALGMALVGVMLTLGPLGASKPLGILLGLLSAIIYAGFVLGSGHLARFVDARVSTAIVIMSAAAILTTLMLLRGPSFPSRLDGWLAAIALGTVSTVLAIMAFLIGVQKVGAVRAATIATVEPMVTVLTAAIFLDERLRLVQIIGGMFILGGMVVLVRFRDASGPPLSEDDLLVSPRT